MTARLVFICLAACSLLAIVLADPGQFDKTDQGIAPSKYVKTSYEANESPHSFDVYRWIYHYVDPNMASVLTPDEVRDRLRELQAEMERIVERHNQLKARAEKTLSEKEVDPEIWEDIQYEVIADKPEENGALKELVSLSSSESGCSSRMLVSLPVAYQVAKKDHRQMMVDYLLKFGREWFDRCSERAIERIEGPGKTGREYLEKFFRKGLGLEDAGQEELLVALKETGWENIGEKFNWEMLIPENDRHHQNSLGSKAWVEFWGQCIHANYSTELEMVNLGAALKGGIDPFEGQTELQIINEIHRICMDVTRNGENFKINMDRILKERWMPQASMHSD